MNATMSSLHGIPSSSSSLNLSLRRAAKDSFNTQSVDKITQFCLSHPNATNSVCQTGLYGYILDFRANTAFTALFIMLLMAYVITWLTRRRAGDFTLAMVLGCLCEILGYAGRTWSQHDQFDVEPFLLQICCLTIGPAFMAAGIYLCLRRIVQSFGPSHSRIPPRWYTRFFIPCDIVSLILQGAGGGLAGRAFKTGGKLKFGNNVMLAGLAFQVFTMLLFILTSLDFAFRVYRRYRAQGHRVLDQNADVAAIRKSTSFKLFLGSLSLATVCIFIRCVFRVAELSGGWTGPLIKNQSLFIVFEGIMIFVAATALAFFNPCFCFKQMSVGTSRAKFGSLFKPNPGARKLPSPPLANSSGVLVHGVDTEMAKI